MSIPVGLDQLESELATRAFAYLLTVSDDGRPHAVAVQPTFADGALSTDAGRRTCANAAVRPAVSLVCPPTEADGYSLIVDGEATVSDSTIRITATRGVLHRPAPAPSDVGDTGGDCGNDCVDLGV